MPGPNLDNYIDVPTRIKEFREKYPEGTLQQVDLQFLELGGRAYVCFTAAAFRTPDDPRPGMGTAWEPVPGPTAFTKDSEVQNAETSAWGRAIIAVGAADASRIASREEVRNRTGDDERETSPLGDFMTLLMESGFTPAVQGDIIAAKLGRKVKNPAELTADEIPLAVEAIEEAIADREQLQS